MNEPKQYIQSKSDLIFEHLETVSTKSYSLMCCLYVQLSRSYFHRNLIKNQIFVEQYEFQRFMSKTLITKRIKNRNLLTKNPSVTRSANKPFSAPPANRVLYNPNCEPTRDNKHKEAERRQPDMKARLFYLIKFRTPGMSVELVSIAVAAFFSLLSLSFPPSNHLAF